MDVTGIASAVRLLHTTDLEGVSSDRLKCGHFVLNVNPVIGCNFDVVNGQNRLGIEVNPSNLGNQDKYELTIFLGEIVTM